MTESTTAPEYIEIFDTTLRDGEQSPGIALSIDEKLDIARQLGRLGVDVIEAGFPISSPANFAAVQAIAREIEGPVICALARTDKQDIDIAAQSLRDAERPRIHTFISTSDIHIEHQMRSTRADVKGLTRAAVAQAKEHYDDVEFSPMDATRADDDFTAEVLQIAIDEGATTINIPDTVGNIMPDLYKAFIGQMYELVPALGGVVLSVHCHDDLGLAVANSLAGAQAGARQIECAINGLGERAGNASLEEIVMLLRTHRDIHGLDTKINTSELGPTSRMVSRHTGYAVQKNKAIVGDNAFKHESGIHQGGMLNNRKTFEIMDPSDVGMDTDGIVLGKQSGRNAIVAALTAEGVYKAPYLKSTFKLFKELADNVGGISRDQIVAIHEEAQRRQVNPYQLRDYQVSASGQQGIYSAEVTITDHEGKDIKVSAKNGLDHSDIDGPISALYTALNEATSTDYKLEKHTIDSIGIGKQTIGKATVVLGINGRTITGHGLSLDTNKAAGWAYLDAISRVPAKHS